MFTTALRAFLVALGSLMLAYWYFAGGVWFFLAVATAMALVGTGAALEWIGRRQLKAAKPRPTLGVRLMGWWVLVPSGLAAVASAVLIIFAVELAADETVSGETKELLGALSAGITAFLTTMWIDPSSKADDVVAERVQAACFEAFVDKAGSSESRLTQVINLGQFPDPSQDKSKNVGLLHDWGYKVRAKRALVIEQELREPTPTV